VAYEDLTWRGDEDRPQPTEAERIEHLEAEVLRLSRAVRDLEPLASKVAAMERKWADKERRDRDISSRMGRF